MPSLGSAAPVCLALLLATGCARLGPGEPCEATGDGFTRVDPCEHTCIEWEVTCPDGTQVTPGVCSGEECVDHDDCPADFTCTQVGAGTACLPATYCAAD